MKEAQRLQMHWLNNTLSHQLHLAKKLESMDKFMATEAANDDQAEKDRSERMRQLNEERRKNEERKMAEAAAQQKYVYVAVTCSPLFSASHLLFSTCPPPYTDSSNRSQRKSLIANCRKWRSSSVNR